MSNRTGPAGPSARGLVVERGAGVLLVVVGILVVTNSLAVLTFYAIRLTPAWLLERL
jgi:hypothetical protein